MSHNNNWSNEKTINFINEIYLHPAVWDVEAKEYRDRYIKKDAWASIANKFNISSDEAYKKLRSLRTYAKNEQKKKKKSGSSGGKQSTWFAYDAISFLLVRDAPDKGIDSENTTEVGETENLGDEFGVSENTNDSFLTEDFVVPTNAPSKEKRAKATNTTLEKAVNIINEASVKRKCEFSAFGEHIANKLMTYDMRTRAHVELEISKILFEADMKIVNDKSNRLTSPLSLLRQDSPFQASYPGNLCNSCSSRACTDIYSPPSTHETSTPENLSTAPTRDQLINDSSQNQSENPSDNNDDITYQAIVEVLE